MKKFSADFETAVWLENETYVWAWASCEIGNEENITIENNIESFMKFLEKNSGSTFYFHNLRFDGEFILCELLRTGFTYIKDRKEAINYALSIAHKNSVVLILGKGRDNYMAIKDKKIHYNDYDVICNYFKSE